MGLDIRQYKGFFESLDEPEEMRSLRKASYDSISDGFRFPSYRYSSLVHLPVPDIDIKEIKNGPDCTIRTDADDDIVIRKGVSDDIFSRFIKPFSDNQEDQTDQLHTTFMNDVLTVEIPDDHRSTRPVVIEIDAGDDALFSSIFIKAGRGSVSKIIMKRRSSDACPFISTRIDLLLDPKARMDLIDIQDLSMETVTLEKRKYHLSDSSTLEASMICMGADYAKADIFSELDGEGADSELKVLDLVTFERKHNIHAESRHNAQDTHSDISTKAVISDYAKSLNTGKIRIGQQAFRSAGYETQKALLVSDSAEADAIPDLEIHNNDVKCSHGSAITQIDTEQLFYLMSRGLSRSEAEQMIIKGFFDEMLEKIGDEDIKYSTDRKIEEMFSRRQNDDKDGGVVTR
ncbi:MAG: SufD family Fe-S cluster assembly protein [Candidatus Woesearchaeota archaeon]